MSHVCVPDHAEYFLSLPASYRIDRNVRDANGRTPLDMAANQDVASLLRQGAAAADAVIERDPAFPCASAAIPPKAHAFACGAAGAFVGRGRRQQRQRRRPAGTSAAARAAGRAQGGAGGQRAEQRRQQQQQPEQHRRGARSGVWQRRPARAARHHTRHSRSAQLRRMCWGGVVAGAVRGPLHHPTTSTSTCTHTPVCAFVGHRNDWRGRRRGVVRARGAGGTHPRRRLRRRPANARAAANGAASGAPHPAVGRRRRRRRQDTAFALCFDCLRG